MATKKRQPYNPFAPYGTHSLEWYTQQANQRAQQDANTAIAALPSASFYTQSAQQLANALRGVQSQQQGVAQAGGNLYAQAFQDASQPANRAIIAAGGQPTTGPNNQGLVQALGASMAGSFAGGQNAAVAQGARNVQDRAKQESTIRSGVAAAQAKYLDQMKQEAFQAKTAAMNQALAQAQFGLQSSNTAFDNNIAAGELSVAQQNAATRAAADAARQKGASKAAKKKARDATIKSAQQAYDRFTRQTSRTTGNTYRFQPNIRQKNPDGSVGALYPAFEVIAPNGSAAVNLAIQHMTNSGVQHISGTQMGTWLQSQKPNTASGPAMDPKKAYVKARDMLVRAGFSMREAQQIMRAYAGI